MSLAYDCVAALRAGEPRGQESLDHVCRAALRRLVERLFAGASPMPDPDQLTQRSLLWAAMYLRTCRPEEFREVSVEEFRARVVLAAARMLTPPDAKPIAQQPRLWARLARWIRPDGPALRSSAFMVWRHTRPLEAVGGDWIGIARGEAGSIWVLVADVTGHGLGAFILARALPTLWDQPSIGAARSSSGDPAGLLGLLGREVSEVLPDDLFVEATLSRFTASGEMTVAAAGGCPVVIREAASGRAQCLKVGGHFLGMDRYDLPPRVPLSSRLRSGDEVLMATDGLFDQPNGEAGPLQASLDRLLSGPVRGKTSLHDAALRAIRDALKHRPQHDDIAIATVKYRGGGQVPSS
jgi:hypothetical protein